ncbi:uncharacterized protein PG986_011374 [Apiospora aurea]|uniref:C2H2-type domain-containing protein n=1 Tax=Apiospora aurea TaxID=335848 RepID=A0ABR1Q4V9_9PEZI
MARMNSAYQLLESYAMLQGAFPVLETLLLPDPINERIRLIKVWCDEWEDLGIPRSPAFDYLRGKGSDHQDQLFGAMDRAYNTMMSRTVRGLAQLGKEQSRGLAALDRVAKARIQQVLRTIHQSPPADLDQQEDRDDADDAQRAEARDARIARAGARIEQACRELVLRGQETLGGGVPGFKWWDSFAPARDKPSEEEHMTRLITINLLRIFAPRLSSSGAGPEVEQEEEHFEPSVVLQRLLHVVARRQRFLKAKRSPLWERQMKRFSGIEDIPGVKIEHVKREIPLMLDRQECCICREKFDEGFWKAKTWEEHVFEDLCPFVCLVEDPRVPNRTYAARADWAWHVFEAHCDTVWLCPVVGCRKARRCFPLPRGLRQHLRAVHPRYPLSPPTRPPNHPRDDNNHEETNTVVSAAATVEEDPGVLADLVRRGERVNILPQMHRCPLCSLRLEDLEHYVGHVGDHLENIALLSTV